MFLNSYLVLKRKFHIDCIISYNFDFRKMFKLTFSHRKVLRGKFPMKKRSQTNLMI